MELGNKRTLNMIRNNIRTNWFFVIAKSGHHESVDNRSEISTSGLLTVVDLGLNHLFPGPVNHHFLILQRQQYTHCFFQDCATNILNWLKS